MEKRNRAFSYACLLPRSARALKPGTYGSLGYPPLLARKPVAAAHHA